MTSSYPVRHLWMPVVLSLAVMLSTAWAQSPGSGLAGATGAAVGNSASMRDASVRVADRSDSLAVPMPPKLGPSQPNEHPLMPALHWAQQGLPAVQGFQDYSATMVKRERVGGKLGEHEYMFAKIRHRPFSVYLYFLGPENLKGQEVIFVQGQNNGNMWAHTIGVKDRLVGTVSLKPDGFIAMQGNRYPLTEIGLVNLVRRLVEVARAGCSVRRVRSEVFPGREDQWPDLHLHSGHSSFPAEQLSVPPGADFCGRRVERAYPLRVVRLAQRARREAGVDRGVYLPQPEGEQRLHRRRLRHPQSQLPVPLIRGSSKGEPRNRAWGTARQGTTRYVNSTKGKRESLAMAGEVFLPFRVFCVSRFVAFS